MPVRGGTNSFGWPLFYFYLYVLCLFFVAIVSFCHCFSCYFRIVLFSSCYFNICLALFRSRFTFCFTFDRFRLLFSYCSVFFFVICVIYSAKATDQCLLFKRTVRVGFSHLKFTDYLVEHGAPKHKL